MNIANLKESTADRKERSKKVLRVLKRLYPEADCALHHDNALHLLLATILSAQSTDETINKVTPVLFSKYPTAADIAKADRADLERILHPTGFFRQKAKSVQNTCLRLVEHHAGQVPDTMAELVELPGVARKTANVVLGTFFGKNEGVVVDTHIGRLATRLALTWRSKNAKDAVKIEKDLMEIVPRKQWTYLGHALIWHGRKVCSARKPDCGNCKLRNHCPSADAEF
jgi:endonuclease III